MKRLLLALLATHNLVHAGVVLVDDAAKKQAAAVAANATSVQAGSPNQASPSGQKPVGGVAAPKTVTVVDAATQSRNYRLKFTDVTVRLALKRWLKETDMQLAYEAQKDFPVPVEGDYTGPISDVMLKLMTSLSESSYPLRACEYDNRVVLVVHRDDKCPLEDKQ